MKLLWKLKRNQSSQPNHIHLAPPVHSPEVKQEFEVAKNKLGRDRNDRL